MPALPYIFRLNRGLLEVDAIETDATLRALLAGHPEVILQDGQGREVRCSVEPGAGAITGRGRFQGLIDVRKPLALVLRGRQRRLHQVGGAKARTKQAREGGKTSAGSKTWGWIRTRRNERCAWYDGAGGLSRSVMAFTVQDFHDLVRLLGEHPDWRAELRRLVLTEDLLRLPRLVEELGEQTRLLAEAQRRTEARLEALTARVDALAEAQRRTEARLEALTARVDALAEAQRRTEARLEALTARVDALAEAQRRTEARLEALTARVDALAEAQRRTEARLEALTARVDALAEAQRQTEQRLAEFAQSTDRRFRDVMDDLGALKGRDLERVYRERAAGYFGRILKGLRVLADHEVDQLLEAAVARDAITWEERDDVLRADLVARGRLRATGQEAYLVVEVSWGVGPEDVERAHRRAGRLQKVTGLALAAVAGVSVLPEARQLAERLGVIRVTDGVLEGSGAGI
ncbi:MAG: hypothetical protein IMX02_10710 [Limnochordaceae bacterium]|nr:hypothetical protein [Limnochordaceae bacterium]